MANEEQLQIQKRHQQSVARSVSLSEPPKQVQVPYVVKQRKSEPTMMSSAESAHSSSSDKSAASTVRSQFSLVKSSIPSIPPAFSVPYLSCSPLLHSTSASDTCSSFDHSYTSSIDSATLTAAQTSPFKGSASRLNNNALDPNGESELRSQAPNYYYSTVPTTSLTMSSTTITPSEMTAVTSMLPTTYLCAGASPTSTMSKNNMVDLYLPPVPIRTEHSYVRSIVTNAARKSTPSTSPQSSNDESSIGYIPSFCGYPVPQTCLNGRQLNGVRNATCMYPPHSVAQCRTKIGVSSLTRPPNPKFGYGPSAQRHGPPSSSQMMNGRYNYSNWGAYSNLLTLGKSISVPNVIDENECLPMSASATYPPMTVPFAIRPNYYSNEALPAYPNNMSLNTSMGLNNQWPVFTDYYMKGLDLPRRYSDSPVSPPNEFACIPPPPPYRNPQGSDSDSIPNAIPNNLTPPRGFRQESPQVQTTAAITTCRTTPNVKPRTVIPMKAKSEDNLLSHGGPKPSYQQNNLNNNIQGGSTDEIKGDFPMIPPPPPYGPEVSFIKSYKNKISKTGN